MEVSGKYNKLLNRMPGIVEDHLKSLIADTGISNNPKMVDRFMESWLLKRAQFQRIVEKGNYRIGKVIFSSNDKNSCVVMTISGSLVTIGPLVNGSRTVAYTSIGLRTDVPMVSVNEKSELEKNIELYKPIFFKIGPIKSTSLIMDIALLGNTMDTENQLKELGFISDFLLKRFIGINMDFLSKKFNDTDLIHRNDLFEKWESLKWFTSGGYGDYILMARAKLIWLELFLKFYKHLADKNFLPAKRDQIFLELTNVRFIKYLNENNLVYGPKKTNNVALLQALEAIPVLGSYVNFGKAFFVEFK